MRGGSSPCHEENSACAANLSRSLVYMCDNMEISLVHAIFEFMSLITF